MGANLGRAAPTRNAQARQWKCVSTSILPTRAQTAPLVSSQIPHHITAHRCVPHAFARLSQPAVTCLATSGSVGSCCHSLPSHVSTARALPTSSPHRFAHCSTHDSSALAACWQFSKLVVPTFRRDSPKTRAGTHAHTALPTKNRIHNGRVVTANQARALASEGHGQHLELLRRRHRRRCLRHGPHCRPRRLQWRRCRRRRHCPFAPCARRQ